MKIHSKPIEEHAEVPLADDGRWEAIVAHWQRREAPQRPPPHAPQGNACYVLSVQHRGDAGDPQAQLAEMASLVRTQGDRVVGMELHQLHRPDPRTLDPQRDRGTDRDRARATRAPICWSSTPS